MEVNQQKLAVAGDALSVPYKPYAFTTVRLKPAKTAAKDAGR